MGGGLGGGGGGSRGGVHNGGSWGRRQTSNLKCLNLIILFFFLLLFLLRWKCSFSDIWSAACAVFLLLHTTYTALIFMVNSLNVFFSCFIVLYSLICTFFIWFPSSFSFSTHHSAIFRSESFSIFSPSLYPSTTYSFFCFPTIPRFIFWPSLTAYFQALFLLVNSHFFLVGTWKYLFTGQDSSPPHFFQLFSAPPISLVSTISFLLSCHHHCSLLSSSPSILLSSVQLHSNPGRQWDLELTAEMRWWNGMTSVVRVCVRICSTNLSSDSH